VNKLFYLGLDSLKIAETKMNCKLFVVFAMLLLTVSKIGKKSLCVFSLWMYSSIFFDIILLCWSIIIWKQYRQSSELGYWATFLKSKRLIYWADKKHYSSLATMYEFGAQKLTPKDIAIFQFWTRLVDSDKFNNHMSVNALI
jgi:hypothetical protein